MSKPKVLLIEDNADIQELVGMMLVAESIELLTADSCDEGMKILEKESPCLLLLDLTLATSQITSRHFVVAARDAHPNMKIVLISGSEHLEPAASAAKVDFLKKPFKADDLSLLVRHSLPHIEA
jgi:DNA-binding NtrC family response regulator